MVTPGCWLLLNSAFWRAEAGGSREENQGDPDQVSPEAPDLPTAPSGPHPTPCTWSLMTLHLAYLSSVFAQCQLQSP